MRSEIHHVVIELAVICEPDEDPVGPSLGYLVENNPIISIMSKQLPLMTLIEQKDELTEEQAAIYLRELGFDVQRKEPS